MHRSQISRFFQKFLTNRVFEIWTRFFEFLEISMTPIGLIFCIIVALSWQAPKIPKVKILENDCFLHWSALTWPIFSKKSCTPFLKIFGQFVAMNSKIIIEKKYVDISCSFWDRGRRVWLDQFRVGVFHWIRFFQKFVSSQFFFFFPPNFSVDRGR
jgi:hypothetical protein